MERLRGWRVAMNLRFSFVVSLLLHLAIVAAIVWLTQNRPKKRSIYKKRMTLDLKKFETLPPAPARSRSVPPAPSKSVSPVVTKKEKPSESRETPPKETPTPKNETIRKKSESVAKEQKSEKEAPADSAVRVPQSPKKSPPKKESRRSEKEKKRVSEKKKSLRKSRKEKRTSSKSRRKVYPKSGKPLFVQHRPKGPDRRLIENLYGSSYSRMSALQRRYIDENLRKILIISQRTLNYLGYPREAAAMRQQGTNIVEFWLHPNGDISGLRLKKRLSSDALNRQTIEVIKTAYMNYPRPKTKTKIIIFVEYRLY